MELKKELVLIALIVFFVLLAGCSAPIKEPENSIQEKPKGTETPSLSEEESTPKPDLNQDLNQETEGMTVKKQVQTIEGTDKNTLFPGPGGCMTVEECTAFCESNPNACEEFCELNPEKQFCEFQPTKPTGESEMSCQTKEECDALCEQNPSACIGQEEWEQQDVIMPFDPKYYTVREGGLWPFCVHGGDHPEGHGGIDFDLKQGVKILAACTGTIEFIEKEETGAEHGEGLMLSCGRFIVSYHGLTNIKPKVGDTVKKGDYIADTAEMEGGGHYIHFEINDYINQKLVCPLPYLDEEFKAKLNEMLEESRYPEKSSEPDLCNCQELPYKESMAADS